MPNPESDFYIDLRARVERWLASDEGAKSEWADYVLAVPDLVHLLVKLTTDPEVPIAEKAKLGAVLAYFLSPIDVIPDALGGRLGLLEDAAIAAFAIKGIVSNTRPDIVKKHWTGRQDILALIQGVADRGDAMVGTAAWSRVKGLVGAG
ncbi:MAG: DUF1232 domain-containing protein [FCB group bacterium]|nr:DUF1232 domain-containing protein [FCB group bacterium]